MLRSRFRSVAVGALVLLLLGSGCGGGDGGSDGASDDPAGSTSIPPQSQAWCDEVLELQGVVTMSNQDALELMRGLRATVPSELGVDLEVVIQVFANLAAEFPSQQADLGLASGYLLSDAEELEFFTAFESLNSYAVDVCGLVETTQPEIDAPTTEPPGTTAAPA